MLKDSSLRAQLQQKQRQELTKQCLQTLEELMTSLLLHDDFKTLQEARKKEL